MDGAIVVNESVTKILKANVHLNPSDSISTTQTGTRHRTAERTSASTGLTVIAVSEETSLIKVFENLQSIELEESSAILGSCLLCTSPSPRDLSTSRMPSSA